MVQNVTALLAICAGTLAAAAPPHGAQSAMKPGWSVAPGIDNPFSDNFDAYAPGTGLAGQGVWQLWAPGAPDAWVDDTRSVSGSNSMRLDVGSDVVATMDLSTGTWRMSMQTWFPSGSFGNGFIIGLNTFAHPAGPYHWSMDMQFNGSLGVVQLWPDQNPPPPIPLITDQWVEVVIEIDLDADLFNAWYGGTQFVFDRQWSSGWSANGLGLARIQAWDFYSESVGGMHIDDVKFEEVGAGCYANCDGSTVAPVLNVDDFTCFINEYAAAQSLPHAQQVTSYPNCDGSTVAPALNVDDFTCFINEYAAGCP